MDSDCWKLVISVSLLSCVACQRSCLDDDFKTGTSAQLTCTYDRKLQLDYLTPNGSMAAACDLDPECKFQDENSLNVTSQNTTSSCVNVDKLKSWICEDVPGTVTTPTMITQTSMCKVEELYIHLFSLGVGVAIGATVSILLIGICLATCLPRRGSSCCHDGKSEYQPESVRADRTRKPRTNASDNRNIGNETEMQESPYAELQRRSFDVPPSYEQLSTYQTL